MTNMIKRENSNGSVVNRRDLPFETWVDGMLKNTLNRFFDDDLFGFESSSKPGNVPVNIGETEKAYELEFILPGLTREDISVSLAGNTLAVSYEHKNEGKQSGDAKNYLRREFFQRSFSRSFTLDETVDPENISGEYTNGVLKVTIPKKEGAQLAKTIEIR